MRANQFNITIFKFGNQVAKGYELLTENVELNNLLYGKYDIDLTGAVQKISIYVDSNNFYEGFCAAFNETVSVIQHFEELPKHEKEDKFISGGNSEVKIFVQHLFSYNNETVFTDKFDINVETVSENIYEAVTAAFNEVLQEIQTKVDLPIFGTKENYSVKGEEENGYM